MEAEICFMNSETDDVNGKEELGKSRKTSLRTIFSYQRSSNCRADVFLMKVCITKAMFFFEGTLLLKHGKFKLTFSL